MKKSFFLLCSVFLLLLSACGGGTEGSVLSSENQSGAEPYVLKSAPEDINQASFGRNFIETPDGYYYTYSGDDSEVPGTFLFFCPRGGDDFRPLCSKPNCMHRDVDCNAFIFGTHGGVVGYYNGALYAVEARRQLNVVKMNLDGTDHKVVATLDDADYTDCSIQIKIHHGRVFLLCRASYDLPVEEQTDHLVVLDLSDHSQKEIATEFLRTASLPSTFFFYKDKLYLLGSGDKTQTLDHYDPYRNKLIEIDAVTGEARTVLSQPIGALYVTDSTLYFFQPDYEAMGYGPGDIVPGFRELDVETGTVKECGLPVEDALWARYDEDYIYALSDTHHNGEDQEEGQTLYILSRNYELLDQFELENGLQVHTIVSDRIYIRQGRPELIVYYLDKSQIGSGNLQLIPIETVG